LGKEICFGANLEKCLTLGFRGIKDFDLLKFFAIQSNDNKDENDLSRTEWVKVVYLKVGDEIAVADKDLKGIEFSKIKEINILPPEQVYDIEVERTHNFVGNGIVAHNTYISATTSIMGYVLQIFLPKLKIIYQKIHLEMSFGPTTEKVLFPVFLNVREEF